LGLPVTNIFGPPKLRWKYWPIKDLDPTHSFNEWLKGFEIVEALDPREYKEKLIPVKIPTQGTEIFARFKKVC